MKEEILKVLKEANGFVSGEQLSNGLGVSRTAIWKAMTKLKEEGYEIESVTRKGYRLMHIPDRLTKEEIRYGLETNFIGKHVVAYDTIDSTNQEIKQLASKGAEHGTILIAEEQTQGKGRKGRTWVSPPGTGIWLSCLLKPNLSPVVAPMMTLVAGLAVCKGIEDITGIKPAIKWPNDIVIDKHKVCGILTEMSAEMDSLHYIVLGIGINVNQNEFPDEIKDMATSLRIKTGKEVSRIGVLNQVLKYLEKYYDILVRDGDLRAIIEDYKAYSITLGSHIKVINNRQEQEGIVTNINATGELILKGLDGKEKVIRSGEVSVRGLYGYV